MDSQPNLTILFGEFELDAAHRRLTRDGKLLALNSKAFDLLIFLVENTGRIVSKDEILNAVWANQFVEEANLTVQISALRRVLGERKEAPRFLITVPGKGYEFVADLNTTNEEIVIERHRVSRLIIGQEIQDDPSLTKQPESNPQIQRSFYFSSANYNILAGIGIGIFLIILAAVWLWRAGELESSKAGTIQNRLELTKLTTNGRVTSATLTADGKYAVFAEREADGESLWLRQIATGSQTRIAPPRHIKYLGLTVSPDNNFVYAAIFQPNNADTPLWKIPLLGGASAEVPGIISGAAISFSPDGKRFAFTSSRSATTETSLSVADADGANVRILQTATDDKRDFIVYQANPLAWSPDGTEIAAAVQERDVDGILKAGITLINAADGSEKFLLKPQFNYIENIAWLDADNLAFADNEKDEQASQIWTVSRKTGAARQLTNDLQKYFCLASAKGELLTIQQNDVGHLQVADFDEKRKTLKPREILNEGTIECVAWTKDGAILYTSRASGSNEIWRIERDGANPVQITSGAQISYGFALSPIDNSIVFSSARGGKNGLWLANADGKDIRSLIDGIDDVFPDFTADGQAVVFQRGYGNKTQTVWRVTISDKSSVQLTQTRSLYPSVSPDGSQIAYYCMSQNSEGSNKWIINLISSADGAQIGKLIVPPEVLNERFSRWYPSGLFLSQIIQTGDSANLVLMPTNGGAAETFSGFDQRNVRWFAWSRNGKQLAVAQTTETQDLVMLTDF